MNEDKWQKFVKGQNDYGDNYQNHLVEIYKSYARTTDNNSARRQTSNTFYLTLNTGLIGVFTYSLNNASKISYLLIPLALFGIGLCFFWRKTLLSHKQLSSGKFKVLLKIEKQLPFEAYEAEWEVLGRGKDRKKYYAITDLEMTIPLVFGLIYSLIGLGLSYYLLSQC